MSITYGFYNSSNGDRKYSAEDFSRLFDCILEDGILTNKGGRFEVTPYSGYIVTVDTGMAWLNGTWTINDSSCQIEITCDDKDKSYQMHAIVIEVDLINRINTIKCVSGTAGSNEGYNNENRVTLAKGENGVYQYPLCYIRTIPRMGSIPSNYIIDRRGNASYGLPFVSNSFSYQGDDAIAHHRNTFRGKYLGSSIRNDQLEEIRSGRFTDIYVGDYWRSICTVNGKEEYIQWRVADIDYFMNTGNPGKDSGMVDKHHIVIVPEMIEKLDTLSADLSTIVGKTLTKGFMLNNPGATGYWEKYNTALSYTRDTLLTSLCNTDVSGLPILTTYDYDVDTLEYSSRADSKVSAKIVIESPQSLRLLNEPMVFGSYIHAANGNNRFSFANRQLSLFRLNPEYIFLGKGVKYWLRDIADELDLVMVHDSGAAFPASATTNNSAYCRFYAVIG